MLCHSEMYSEMMLCDPSKAQLKAQQLSPVRFKAFAFAYRQRLSTVEVKCERPSF